jgi:hypothetical protein
LGPVGAEEMTLGGLRVCVHALVREREVLGWVEEESLRDDSVSVTETLQGLGVKLEWGMGLERRGGSPARRCVQRGRRARRRVPAGRTAPPARAPGTPPPTPKPSAPASVAGRHCNYWLHLHALQFDGRRQDYCLLGYRCHDNRDKSSESLGALGTRPLQSTSRQSRQGPSLGALGGRTSGSNRRVSSALPLPAEFESAIEFSQAPLRAVETNADGGGDKLSSIALSLLD